MARVLTALMFAFATAACSGPEDNTEDDLCADTSCNVGSQCEPTTGECVPVDAGHDPADAGEDVSDAGEDSPDAGEDVSDAGEDPPDAGEDVSDAGEDPPDAGEDPPDAGENPPDAGEDPPDAGEDPPDAGEDPPDAGEDVSDAGEDPPDAGEDPPDAGEEPPDAGEDPPDAGEDPPDAGEEPCGGGCSGLTPICDEATDTCVACTAFAGCGGDTAVCDTSVIGGQCVTCTDTEGCSGDTAVCDTSVAGGQCVTCTDSAGCSGDTPVCDTSVAGGQCVTCIGSADCSGDTPVCDTSVAGGQCVTCIGSADCSGDTPVCDTSVAGGQCVTCTDTEGCSGDTAVCDSSVAGGQCVQCLDDDQCSNPTPVCEANACRGCASDNECAVTAFCEDGGACRPLPDTCALALDVDLPSPVGEVSFVADTTYMNDDVKGSCSASGAELVYRLPLAQAADVTVTVKPAAGSTADPVFYLRGGVCQNGSELVCWNAASDPQPVEPATLMNQSGDLFLFVETAGTTKGAVDVTIKLEPPTVPPPNDTCATADQGLLTFDEHGHAEATGSTWFATNGAPKTDCSYTARQDGLDVVHQFVLEEIRDVSVRLEATAGSLLQPVVGVWAMDDCETGTRTNELACQGDSGHPTQVAEVSLRDLEPGTYAVLVDGAGDTKGRYRLSVDLAQPAPPPENEDCATAEELLFTDGIAAVAGDTWAARNDYADKQSPSCSPSARSGGNDVFYKFTTTTTRNLVAHLHPTGVAPTYVPVLTLRPEAHCATGLKGAEAGCEFQTDPLPLEMRVLDLPPGTWYLHVDSLGVDGAGPFELDVMLSDPPPRASNDDCSDPEPLTFTNGRATARGDLAAASNAGGVLSCSPSAVNSGRDLVYQYTLSQTSDVSVVVIPDDHTLAPVLSVHNACVNASGTELVCRQGTVGGQAIERPVAGQAAGTYWIWVDSYANASGPFTLDVQTGPSPNNTCNSPRPLTLGQKTVAHTNFGPLNDYATYCSGCGTFNGAEVVYAYTEPTGGTRTVTVRPSQLFDAAIIRIEGACAAANAVAVEDKQAQGYAETMTFTATAGTTYWFVVDADAESRSRGAFEIEVK